MASDETSDGELFRRWAEGESKAGSVLIDRHYEAIERFFHNKVSDGADDLVQQTFVACVEGRSRFRGDSSFRSYLFGIAYNLLRRHFRTRSRSKIVWAEVTSADLSPGPSTMLRQHREKRLLLEALRHVPIEYQTILELFYWEELSAVAIAEIVGAVENTVRNRLRRGRELVDAKMRELATSPEELQRTMADLVELDRAL